jgi:hypothetical protein
MSLNYDKRNSQLKEALELVRRNVSNGWWAPLKEPVKTLVREYYRSQLSLPIDGLNIKLRNSKGTLIANGYQRIVVGDYGAYIEFSKDQAVLENIKSKWSGEPKKPVKYLWLETIDDERTKIYHQQQTVKYADYKIGMFYVNPKEVISEE